MSKKIVPFNSYEGKKTKEKHIRLTKSMLLDENYISLSYSSKVIYNYMKLWASGNIEFDYAKSLPTISKISSESTTLKCIRELINKGFIERVYFSSGGGHKSNRYKFSDNWKKFANKK